MFVKRMIAIPFRVGGCSHALFFVLGGVMMVITVKEFADRMKISMPTAYAFTEQEGFPVTRVGRKKLIPVKELETWLSKEAARGKTV